MNWLRNFVRPKIRSILPQRDVGENMWQKCPSCSKMIFHRELADNQHVCTNCGFHMRLGAADRLKSLFDNGSYKKLKNPTVPVDPLKFRDLKKYPDRLKAAYAKTEKSAPDDCISAAQGKISGVQTTVAVFEFDFMGGSMGTAAGEAIVQSMQNAAKNNTPYIIFVASGGARMQEGILSLMQMPRTIIAAEMLREKNLPFIVVLTNPTTGGVSASFAMIGDVHIAEPGAIIGFAGARVIQETIREKLPEGFQRAEYLLDHGMVDMVVERQDLRATLIRLIRLMLKKPALKEVA